jgi:site-specific DNA recombinase
MKNPKPTVREEVVASFGSTVIYCRVSTLDQKRDGYSLPTQVEACEKYAREKELQVSPENILQESASGTELIERTILSDIRERIRRREIKILICYAVDRLSRDSAHLYIISEECERYGCELHFVTEEFDKSPEGKLLMSIRGYVAEVERAKLRERVQRGRMGKLKSGKIHSEGFEKYGWRREKVSGKFTGKRLVYEPEAEVIRQVFNLYGNQNWSMLKIAQFLNGKGVPSPAVSIKRNYKSGKVPQWNKKTISNLILDSDYKGETIVWRTQLVGKGKDKKQVLRDIGEMIRMPEDVSEAIVLPELWEFCQKRRVNNISTRKRAGSVDCLVRGLIHCGYCGFKMTLNRGGRNGKLRVQYCCNRKWDSVNLSRPRCQGRSASQPIVDSIVWDFVEGILLRPELLQAAVNAYETIGVDFRLIEEIESCEMAIKKITGAQVNLVRSMKSGSDTLRAIIQKELVEQDQQLIALQQELASLRSTSSAKTRAQDSFMSIAAFCERAAENIENLTFERRRQLIEVLGVKVYINGRDNIEVEMFFDPATNAFVFNPVMIPLTKKTDSLPAPFNADSSPLLADTSLIQDTSNISGAERCIYVSRKAPAGD